MEQGNPALSIFECFKSFKMEKSKRSCFKVSDTGICPHCKGKELVKNGFTKLSLSHRKETAQGKSLWYQPHRTL